MFLPNALKVAIGNLECHPINLRLKPICANGVPKEENICRLCHTDVEDKYHFTCKCLAYVEIRDTRSLYLRAKTSERE